MSSKMLSILRLSRICGQNGVRSDLRCCCRTIITDTRTLSQKAVQTAPEEMKKEKEKISDPLNNPDFFNVKNYTTVKSLFEHRVHLGHRSDVRNPYMTPYLFGSRMDYDIFDLERTKSHLLKALNFTAHIVYKGGVVLFVSRHKETRSIIEHSAFECGEYAHCRFWTPGTFTDSTNRFKGVTRLPDVCIFFNTLNNAFEQHIAITECAKVLIPTIGIVDSNCDPRLITYPVPGSDDNAYTINLYVHLFRGTIMKAKKARQAAGLDTKMASKDEVEARFK